MDAQLMRTPGPGFEFEPRDRRAAPCSASPDAPERQRLLAARIHLHPPAALLVEPAERQVDRPALAGGIAPDDRPIGLGDLALLEQTPQCLQRFVMAPQHQAAGGVAVEPMRERRLARQAEAERVEIILEARAPFRTGVNRDAGGLIEDKHHPVAIEEAASCFFRGHGKKWYGNVGRAHRGGFEESFALDDNDRKAKPGLIRRWFGGAEPEAALTEPPPPVAREAGPPAELPVPTAAPAPKPSWLQRLRAGLSRSSTTIARGVADIFTKRKLDAASLDDLEDVLIQADLGLAAASRIREAVAHGRYERGISPEEVKQILADEVDRALEPVARPLTIDPDKRPFVILVVGVNGSGKTTTIGKLAAKFRAEGKSVLLAAGDTFRAAAIEQLRIWARRTFSALVEREQGADAAGLAFDALTQARELNVDVVLMDTAGRLQNRAELMSELEKIIRVMRKVDAGAPHAVLLVLDATVGQNAMSQVEIFGRVAGVTGLVMTKLDGTARGGILVAIADKFALPVHFIGVGEGVDDLEPFAARDFADAIAGIEREAA
jgi:fused signal recognition particle receptor